MLQISKSDSSDSLARSMNTVALVCWPALAIRLKILKLRRNAIEVCAPQSSVISAQTSSRHSSQP